MISIVTERGVLDFPRLLPGTEQVKGNCDHGFNLFGDCPECLWLEAYPLALTRMQVERQEQSI